MNKQEQLEKMKHGKGFVAALDQSGGSTPKALATYGIPETAYSNEDEMFDQVHKMRTRIISSPGFTGQRILGAILFKGTMERQIDGQPSADYLWGKKQVVPFLKIDLGLADESDGVQFMKPISDITETLQRANEMHIFGTKMRSVIKGLNKEAISKVVDQQFDYAKQIIAAGLSPIVEPEVDIHSEQKGEIEAVLKTEIKKHLDQLSENQNVLLKLTLPDQDDLYQELTEHPRVIRVLALSGGYHREEANAKLKKNHAVIASFSRVLAEGLRADQSDEDFNATIEQTIQSVYEASVNK